MKSGTQALPHGTFDLRMHMQARHSVQNMQMSQGPARPLLTALEVQELLHIDRSTVYRMAEDGRLPAIRVGRSWRFPADRIEAMLDSGPADGESGHPSPSLALGTGAPALSVVPEPALERGPDPRDLDATATLDPTLNTDAASAAVEVAADLLGVMMVVTDMHGQPVTDVANPSTWFAAHADEPEVLDACVTEWRDLADHPDFTPRFQEGALGFQCARAFIRHGTHAGRDGPGRRGEPLDRRVASTPTCTTSTTPRAVGCSTPCPGSLRRSPPPRRAPRRPPRLPHPAATTKEN